MLAHRSFLAFALIAAAGCATSPAASDPAATGTGTPAASEAAAENTIAVTVTHNQPDAGITTIYVEPAAGVRTTLGTIEVGSTKTFVYRVESQNRRVALVALNSQGQQIRSEQITVPRGAGLAWNLQINSVRISR